jgi:hypothetical protein
VAGFDLTFSPSRSVSVAWALADRDTKEKIYACHRRAIEVVLTFAEGEVFHSRSGTNGVVQEDIEGVVAAAFTHFDSRAGDPQLHDHVVVANRARSLSAWADFSPTKSGRLISPLSSANSANRTTLAGQQVLVGSTLTRNPPPRRLGPSLRLMLRTQSERRRVSGFASFACTGGGLLRTGGELGHPRARSAP